MPKEKKETSRTKVKPIKDKNAPKKPAGPYIFFCNDKRQQVKEDHPDLQNQDIYRALGELWKSLTDEERQPYYDKAKEDKERYKKALEAYDKQQAAVA